MPGAAPDRRSSRRTAGPSGRDVLEQLRAVVRLGAAHSASVERATGLSGAQLWALQEVAEAEGLKVGELAERLRVHQTTSSNLLKKLEAQGFVRKGRSTTDGRVVHLHPTVAGRRVLRKVAPRVGPSLLPSVLDAMDAARLKKVHGGLALLLDALVAAAAGPVKATGG